MNSSTSKVVVIALALAGCFVTRTETGADGIGPEVEQHQWFTGWGSVQLSAPGGGECTGGLARLESGMGFGDLLIDGALAIATGIAGSFACPMHDAKVYASCTAAFAGIGPALIARKTVHYRCR